jgi:hypothetical protein
VAAAEPDGEVRSLGVIPNRIESIRKLVKKLGPVKQLRACYEAGPTRYVVYRQLTALEVTCEVVAPTLVPVTAAHGIERRRCERTLERRADPARYYQRRQCPSSSRHCRSRLGLSTPTRRGRRAAQTPMLSIFVGPLIPMTSDFFHDLDRSSFVQSTQSAGRLRIGQRPPHELSELGACRDNLSR